MPESLKKLRIFAASPSDVTNERAKLETVIDSLKPMADYLGLTLEVVEWRSVVPDAGRPQQIIFDQLKPTSWDIFIGILWHRFGTPPGAKDKDGIDYLSGTEEEFKTAYELWKQKGKPRMVLYRCTRALPFDVDPDQLKSARAFFKLIEDAKGDYPTLYQTFDTTESFEKLVLNNLQKLLVEYGEESKRPITPEVAQVLAPKIPNNLPRRQAFFGRTKEMDIAMRALSPDDRTWGVLVDGIGGIGKSAIAIEAAYRLQDAGLFEAVVFVTAKQNILEPKGIKHLDPPARTLDELLIETACVLGQSGIAKLTGDEKRSALIDVLRSMRTLLIYDNLETLLKEEQEGIADFLRELPQGCKAIITSRRRGGEGGVWLRVEKLDWEAALGIIKNQISLDTGLANKLNRVGETRWQELFDETNGSPLTLVHTLGLMRVRAALTFDGALNMLQGNGDADLQRFIFQEARKELTENDKAALGALSFFVPSATFEAWMEVADLSHNSLEMTIDRLSALSLVDVLIGEERYALHPLTRAYVRDELFVDLNIRRETGMRFARYWVEYSQRYGDDFKSFGRFEVERDNINETISWMQHFGIAWKGVISNTELAKMFDNLIDALSQFFLFRGLWDEWIQLNEYTYEVMCLQSDWSNAGWRAYDLAWINYSRADVGKAQYWGDLASEAWERGGNKREQTAGMMMRGLIARQRHDYHVAKNLITDALAAFQQLKLTRESAIALKELGALEREAHNYLDAEKYFLSALEMARRYEDTEGETRCLLELGNLSSSLLNWAKAREQFEKALPLANKVGRIELMADAQYGLARTYEAEGHGDLALPLAKEALKIYEQLRHKDLTNVRELMEMIKSPKG